MKTISFWQMLIWAAINCAAGVVAHSELVVEIRSGPQGDAANSVNAYETIVIQIDPVDGISSKEETLGPAWRVKFDVDPGRVQKLVWRINGGDHEFILWPLEVSGPFGAKFNGFKLRTLHDVHSEYRERPLTPISRQPPDLLRAQAEFNMLATLYGRVPKGKLRDGSSSAELKHWVLREMLARAAEYRKDDWRWEKKTNEDKESWLKTERAWHVELVTNNKGATDENGLSRLMEATSLWWAFVVLQDFTLKEGWHKEKPVSDTPFKDAGHAEQFRQDWADVQRCLSQEQTRLELDRIAAKKQSAFAKEVREALEIWSTHAKSKFQEATIGQIESAINGVYQLFGKTQDVRRATTPNVDSYSRTAESNADRTVTTAFVRTKLRGF